MGIGLTLLPLDHDSEELRFAHSMLQCKCARYLREAIKDPHPFGAALSCYLATGEDGEPCYGDVTTDDYGTALTYLRAGELLAFRDHEPIRANAMNRAVWAYLSELEPNKRVVLFWS